MSRFFISFAALSSIQVDIDCQAKFAGGSLFRDCDRAFVCASDITEWKFQYLGGGCSDDETSARHYDCRTYYDGPDKNQSVRIMVVYGDWYDKITSGVAGTYNKAKDHLNDLTDNRLYSIEIFDRVQEVGDFYELKDLTTNPRDAPHKVDTDRMTYIVFESGGDEKLLLKATWEWECTGSNKGRFSIFDNFASSQLEGFDSERYGYVQPGTGMSPSAMLNPSAQMKLTTTIDNKCDAAEGMVVHLDRRFCYRDVGDVGYTCQPPPNYGPALSTSAKLCVDKGQYATDAQCDANGPMPGEGLNNVPFVVKAGGKITFTDTYFDTLQIEEGREFQYRVPNATVYFKHGEGEFVQNLNNRADWFFGSATLPEGECDVSLFSSSNFFFILVPAPLC